jgi:hypothetical protein
MQYLCKYKVYILDDWEAYSANEKTKNKRAVNSIYCSFDFITIRKSRFWRLFLFHGGIAYIGNSFFSFSTKYTIANKPLGSFANRLAELLPIYGTRIVCNSVLKDTCAFPFVQKRTLAAIMQIDIDFIVLKIYV